MNFGLTCKDYLDRQNVYGSQLFVKHRSYFFAIFQKSIGKMHSFSMEGTHAPLASKLSYKVTSY